MNMVTPQACAAWTRTSKAVLGGKLVAVQFGLQTLRNLEQPSRANHCAPAVPVGRACTLYSANAQSLSSGTSHSMASQAVPTPSFRTLCGACAGNILGGEKWDAHESGDDDDEERRMGRNIKPWRRYQGSATALQVADKTCEAQSHNFRPLEQQLNRNRRGRTRPSHPTTLSDKMASLYMDACMRDFSRSRSRASVGAIAVQVRRRSGVACFTCH